MIKLPFGIHSLGVYVLGNFFGIFITQAHTLGFKAVWYIKEYFIDFLEHF